MRIDVISLFPNMFRGFLNESIVCKAVEKKLLDLGFFNPREFSDDKHGRVDGYPFGGGAGMVIKPEPVARLIDQLHEAGGPYDEIIFLTPDGETLRQPTLNQLSLHKRLLLIAGHYKGLDQRIRDHYVTREISIGDYVLTGGELPAAVLIDGIARLIPGVIGDETSALSDSFQDGLLDPPHYTRPANWRGHDIPQVLLSGDHARIDQWRYEQAVAKTKERRPDLLQGDEEAPNT